MFCKKDVLRNFAKFTGKHQQNSLQNSQEKVTSLKKETLAQMFFCKFCKISKAFFFIEQLRWLFLSKATSINVTMSIFFPKELLLYKFDFFKFLMDLYVSYDFYLF